MHTCPSYIPIVLHGNSIIMFATYGSIFAAYRVKQPSVHAAEEGHLEIVKFLVDLADNQEHQMFRKIGDYRHFIYDEAIRMMKHFPKKQVNLDILKTLKDLKKKWKKIEKSKVWSCSGLKFLLRH